MKTTTDDPTTTNRRLYLQCQVAQVARLNKILEVLNAYGMGTMSPFICYYPKSDASLDTLIDLASSSANWTAGDARYLVDKIEQLEAAGTWPKKLQGEPKTWERFCAEVLGYPAYYIEYIHEAVRLLDSQAADQGDGAGDGR